MMQYVKTAAVIIAVLAIANRISFTKAILTPADGKTFF